MTIYDKLNCLKEKRENSYWANRVIWQIHYGLQLSAAEGHKYTKRIEEVADSLLDTVRETGTIPDEAAKKAEAQLASFLSKIAKQITVVCVAHAHIDMNWKWGMQETTAITVDTFRTMLELMKEYPDFTFAASQASVYKIVEEYAPDMLEEIKQRIKEGRWEVTASTWVEGDKNMPNGESLSRHILYTKQYLSKLLDLDPDSLNLDFEPDTFGHSRNVPEVLNKGGIRYYYHCRGNSHEYFYRWKAPSGASVLTVCDPNWYGCWDFKPEKHLMDIPILCKHYGVDCALKVYGVGDHGGGPSRREIESILDCMTWPVLPTIRFGTYRAFFRMLEKFADRLPVVDHELNFVFSGCYTSQSRIKMANRISEEKLYEAESLCAAASLLSGKSFAGCFGKAWKRVLFNQFHDILPGSCMAEAREYALADFQKTLAAANTAATEAMRILSANIDTSDIAFDLKKDSYSEGGGVGYGVNQESGFFFPQTERGRGKVRVFHIFNPTEFDRKTLTEIAVWDWDYDTARILVTDAAREAVPVQLLHEKREYMGHEYFALLLPVNIPAFGYATYILTEAEASLPDLNTLWNTLPEIDTVNRLAVCRENPIVLKNDKIKAVFDRRTMQLLSLTDLQTGEEKIAKDRPAGIFRLIWEEAVSEMTSWKIGAYREVINLNETCPVRVSEPHTDGLRKWVEYELSFRRSNLKITASLDEGSSILKFHITADWHEIGSQEAGVPMLTFYAPLAYETEQYRYDVPLGMLDRADQAYDMPANSFAAALNAEGKPVMLIADTKYGFRTTDNSLSVSLIRSSYEPDPYPEYGIHTINLGLAIADDACGKTLAKIRGELVYPLPFLSGTSHAGNLPLCGRAMQLSGSCRLSAIKTAEDSADGRSLIVRLYDADGEGGTASLTFARDIENAWITDITEKEQTRLKADGKALSVPVRPHETVTIKLTLTR